MSTDSSELICGIDLGTTNSCISIINQGQPEIVTVAGRKTMPSVVACRNGEWLVGEAAHNHLWVAPDEAIASVKRKMDDPSFRVQIGGETLSPIDISAKILRELALAAQKQAGVELDKAVITVPAWFQETQRQATLAAGKQAGLDVIQIINEPTAAAIAHQNIPIADGEEEKWLVYDLGGGTFDVSVLNVTNATYEVLASMGNTFLGGDDFDHRLAEKFSQHLRDLHNVDPNADNVAKTRLQLLAEQTKVKLSTETQVHLNEPISIGSETFLLDMTVTREDFEQLIDDLIASTEEKSSQALTEAGVQVEALDRLLLVGGSTHIPLVAERLKNRFSLDPEDWLDPDLSVALGASVRCAIACNYYFERSVIDICQHSLGIAAVGEEDYLLGTDNFNAMDGHDHPLSFTPLIRRNNRLPASFTRTFYKSHETQDHVLIPVYQGENRNNLQNTFIGEFSVELNNHYDSKLDIHFSYDLNGTIKISVSETGNEPARVFSMDLSRSAEENSDRDKFTEQTLEHDTQPEDDTEDVSNYLIEKVRTCLLQEGDKAPPEIQQLLDTYISLVAENADEEIDVIEDKLYDWIESE